MIFTSSPSAAMRGSHHLAEGFAKDVFELSLEKTRQKYGFAVVGYVVMPEHVHLLVTEPPEESLARILQALKISVSKHLPPKPFWQRRYYDFNVFTFGKQAEKLGYMHRNPVTRGLVETPAGWKWSSHNYYETGLTGTIEIEPGW